jgi:hypothetical protein
MNDKRFYVLKSKFYVYLVLFLFLIATILASFVVNSSYIESEQNLLDENHNLTPALKDDILTSTIDPNSGAVTPNDNDDNNVIYGNDWREVINPDGSRTQTIGFPTYYKDGSYHPVDTSIKPLDQGEYSFGVQEGKYQAYFKQDISEPMPVMVNYLGYEMGMQLNEIGYLDGDSNNNIVKPGGSQTIQNDQNSITYMGILPDIDLEYVYGISELKENIILKDISSYNFLPNDETNLNMYFEISYPIGLVPWSDGEIVNEKTIIESGIDFKNNEGKVIYSIPTPIIYEKNNPLNQVNGQFDAEVTPLGLNLVLKAPFKWILDPSREFPIVIDPSISTPTQIFTNEMVSIWRGGWESHKELLYTGWINAELSHTFLWFNLSTVPAFSTVISSEVFIACNASIGSGAQNILPFRVIEEWDEDDLKSYLDDRAVAENYTPAQNLDTIGKYYSWNITPLAQGWISQYYANHGLAFTTNQHWGASHYSSIRNDKQANPPYLNITYINNSVEIVPTIPNVVIPEDTSTNMVLNGHEQRRFVKFNTLNQSFNAIPFFGGFYTSTRTQYIYKSDEIGMSGIIDKISFMKRDIDTGYFENFSIRMAHTEKTDLTANLDSNYHRGLIEVYNKSRFYINESNYQLITIDILNIFNYQTIYNLVVDIRWLGDNGQAISVQTSVITNGRAYSDNYYKTTADGVDSSRDDLKFEVISSDEVYQDDYTGGWSIPFPASGTTAVRHQMLFRQSMIGKSGFIDKIYFNKFDQSYGSYENLSITLVNTNKTELTTTFATNYGSGTPVVVLPNTTKFVSGKTGNWIEFDVNNVFYYNNYDHLLFEIRWRVNNATSTVWMNFKSNSLNPDYYSSLYAFDDFALTGIQAKLMDVLKFKFIDTDLNWDITGVDPTLLSINPADINPGDDRFAITTVPDAFGSDVVRATLTDTLQGWTAFQFVTIDVTPVNDPPMIPINVTPGTNPERVWYATPIPISWEHMDIDSPQVNVSIEYKIGVLGIWKKVFNSTDTPTPYPDPDYLWLKPILGANIYFRISTSDGEYWSPWNETPYPIGYDNITPVIESVRIIDMAMNNDQYVRNGHEVLISAKLTEKYFAGFLPPGDLVFADLTGFSQDSNVPLNLDVNKQYANITLNYTLVTTVPDNGFLPVPVIVPTLLGIPYEYLGSTIADNLGVEFSEPSVPPTKWFNYTQNIPFSLNISDLGSGVDPASVGYSVSQDSGSNWGSWISIPSSGRSRGDNIIPQVLLNLTEGVKNRVRFRGKDNIGNDYVESPEYQIRIDTRGATYSEIVPSTMNWYDKSNILCSINISDNISGVDPATIRYKFSTTGLGGYGPWEPIAPTNKTIIGNSVRCVVELDFNEGVNNWLKWTATDIAGNVIETDQLNYKVDLTTPTYRDPDPPQMGWVNNYQYRCKIIFEDAYSGVDSATIQYRTSKTGIGNYSAWKDATNITVITLNEFEATGVGDFQDGDKNFIQWRASDIVGHTVETDNFQIFIDLTAVTFSSPKPVFGNNPLTWSPFTSVKCNITINDGASGSKVDATSIAYRFSTNGTDLSQFSEWKPLGLSALLNTALIEVSANVIFDYGDQNYIQWRAEDVAGNGPTESPMYQIKVKRPDSDGDGMPDSWEEQYNLDPGNPDDAGDDDDNDGLTNLQEYNLITTYGDSTDPKNPDTDGDGFNDGDEVDEGTDPFDILKFPEKKGPSKEADDYTWLWLLLIIIIIIVILLVLFLVLRRKRGEEEDRRPEDVDEWERDEEEEEPQEEEEDEYEEEEEDVGEWAIEDAEEEPELEPELEAAEVAAAPAGGEDEFIDIDLTEKTKPIKGKMPADKKGKKKPDIIRHGKMPKGKIPKGKMPKGKFPEEPKKEKPPKKGKLPKKEKKVVEEEEPDIDEEATAVEAMEEELVEAEAEPAGPVLTKLDESATCNICLGAIKTGLPVVKCTCSKKYHESCASRVSVCPNCDTDLTNPYDDTAEEDDEITDDDLDAIGDD